MGPHSEAALLAGDRGGEAAAIRRLESMYAIVFSFGGIPLIYMGDELALRNDPGWAADPAHAHDNRWMHRPPMDWDAARPAAAPRCWPPGTAACWPTAGRTRAVRRSCR